MPENLPWFPLYVQDILTSRTVKAMPHKEVGCYFLLLCHEWDGGPLPTDMRSLGALIGLASPAMKKVWETVGECFVQTDEGYINERLETIRTEQIERFGQRSKAGARAARSRWESHPNRIRGASESHSESHPNGNAAAVRSQSDRNALRDKKRTEKSRTEEHTESGKASEGSPRTRPLPDDWLPDESHQRLAADLGLDAPQEAAKMRAWATSKGIERVNWGATFTTWLHKALEFAKNGANSPKSNAQEDQYDDRWFKDHDPNYEPTYRP